jgi:putative ABC transport system ATP-binding protein
MLEMQGVSKTHRGKFGIVRVLSDVSLSVARGELCALTGPSGSGKTTLMNLIGLLDCPDCGEILIDGVATSGIAEPELARLRNYLIGFVFQSFHLLPRLTVINNVALPLLHRGVSASQRRTAAREVLQKVGLSDRGEHRPEQLSGGQRQRVAIARALVGEPSLLLADEPTGNLDSQSSGEIMDLFRDINQRFGVTIVIVTHDPTIAARCPRRLVMRDGRIEADNRGELRAIGGRP